MTGFRCIRELTILGAGEKQGQINDADLYQGKMRALLASKMGVSVLTTGCTILHDSTCQSFRNNPFAPSHFDYCHSLSDTSLIVLCAGIVAAQGAPWGSKLVRCFLRPLHCPCTHLAR